MIASFKKYVFLARSAVFRMKFERIDYISLSPDERRMLDFYVGSFWAWLRSAFDHDGDSCGIRSADDVDWIGSHYMHGISLFAVCRI